MTKLSPFYLLITLFIMSLNVAMAQQQDEQQQTHTLNLQDTDIRLLVETISDMTGKNFVVDPEVTGKITVISSQPIPEDEVYDLFLSVLSVNGYTTEERNNVIKILPVGKSNPMYSQGEGHPDDLMTRIFRVEHMAVEDVMQVIKSINPKAKIIANADGNMLIVSDKRSHLDRMQTLIDNIDLQSDSAIELIALQYANAQDVADTLTQLLETGNNLGLWRMLCK